MANSFSKKVVFPIIGRIIDHHLLSDNSINRDEIIELLLLSPEAKYLIEKAVNEFQTDDLAKVAGNMIDWFSAEITRKSNIALPWVNKYSRSKVKVNGRKVWSYRLREEIYPDEIPPSDKKEANYTEGSVKRVTVNSYERNPRARLRCIEIYGYVCSCCGLDFYDMYGEIGLGFIHVHHIQPVSYKNEEYKVDPENDLRPVCPNCHAMIHRKNPPFTIEDIKEIIKTPNKAN